MEKTLANPVIQAARSGLLYLPLPPFSSISPLVLVGTASSVYAFVFFKYFHETDFLATISWLPKKTQAAAGTIFKWSLCALPITGTLIGLSAAERQYPALARTGLFLYLPLLKICKNFLSSDEPAPAAGSLLEKCIIVGAHINALVPAALTQKPSLGTLMQLVASVPLPFTLTMSKYF